MIEFIKDMAFCEPEYRASQSNRFAIQTVLIIVALTMTMRLENTALSQTALVELPSAGAQTDLDHAIAYLDTSRARFKKIRDYDCRLIKRERVKGTLLPESVMTMKVRNQPFSIYLQFESPNEDKGLAVCYVDGRNRGKMRVRPAGIKGILDFWSVDPHDARAFQKNRHCITEAGIGNLLESTARYWEMERRLNKTVVQISEDQVGNIACTRIETIHSDPNAGDFYGYRCVLWLDKKTFLPVGAETYDWPRSGSNKGGDLLESYRYLDLRWNVGLNDDDFRH